MTQCDTTTVTSPTTATSDDPFGPVALMAGLTGSNTRQIELLRIITDPALNNGNIEGETPMEIADSYEETFSGYINYGHNGEVQMIADFLHNHYSGIDGAPQFSFGFDCDEEGSISGFLVSADIGEYPNRLTLATWGDIKNSTNDREATGLKAALAIAEALDDMYHAQVVKARRHGLLPADVSLVERAAAALDAYDAVPANEDLDVDTAIELHDCLVALLAAQGHFPSRA